MNNTNVHDKFIRAILSDKSIAEAYFRRCLPPAIERQLDFSTLIRESCTYISSQLRETMSDIVYGCEIKNKKEKVKISLLIEHKSYPEKYTPVQIGSYIFSALHEQVKLRQPLRVVIPVLLYHGKGKWKYYTLNALFEGISDEWRAFIPDFSYIYDNLGEIEDLQIVQLQNCFLCASMLALKHTYEVSWLKHNAPRLLALTTGVEQHLRISYFIYLLRRANFREDELQELALALPGEPKKQVMNTFDRIFADGKKEEARKIALTMLSKGFSAEQVSELTGLPIKVVLKLK